LGWFDLERVFKVKLSELGSKLQQAAFRISSQVRCVASIINLEDTSNESNKTFYLLSLLLLISFIFLSPDKVSQTFSQEHAETGILEKMQKITKIIKRLIYNLF